MALQVARAAPMRPRGRLPVTDQLAEAVVLEPVGSCSALQRYSCPSSRCSNKGPPL
eukprot:CAMPEP_0174709696 /NCGR_PEP_ID=MMETSP1094-20130205/11569_1 /TAXON_ID=156173 /ORGANISM="Chrysochromulina brevifilum, Strain UTEX LB 985" /LENGTH=55 /DNA_ID=CAMNT_0015908397 /DNA_START=379 /DNA_END=546 /DNA_ORIENTATION=-